MRPLLVGREQGRRLIEKIGSPAVWLRETIGRQAAARNLLVRECLEQKMRSVQAELEGPDPTPMERLLAERAAVCWCLVNWHERTFEAAGEMTIAQAEFYQKKINWSHGRLLSAVTTPARVRKMVVPVVLMSIAKHQADEAPAAPSEPPSLVPPRLAPRPAPEPTRTVSRPRPGSRGCAAAS